MYQHLLFYFILVLTACAQEEADRHNQIEKRYVNSLISEVKMDTIVLAHGFDFPVGKPDGEGFYNAQVFGENNHLGEDWNGLGGGDTDFGDPIYSIANGYVISAENLKGGWGKVIRIVHYMDKENQVESLYAHCEKMHVRKGQKVSRGELIGTIGNNDGLYLSHLHFELRDKLGMPIGGGYGKERVGYLDPTEFIEHNR